MNCIQRPYSTKAANPDYLHCFPPVVRSSPSLATSIAPRASSSCETRHHRVSRRLPRSFPAPATARPDHGQGSSSSSQCPDWAWHLQCDLQRGALPSSLFVFAHAGTREAFWSIIWAAAFFPTCMIAMPLRRQSHLSLVPPWRNTLTSFPLLLPCRLVIWVSHLLLSTYSRIPARDIPSKVVRKPLSNSHTIQ